MEELDCVSGSVWGRVDRKNKIRFTCRKNASTLSIHESDTHT